MRLYQELTPPEFHELEQRLVSEVLRSGQAARYRKEYWSKTDKRVPVEITAFLVRNSDGQATGLATIAHETGAV